MIDHITFGVTDFARSVAFYDCAFAPLGVTRVFTVPLEHSGGVNVTGYGDHTPWFWIAEERATTGTLHIALRAPDRASVDAFYAAAIKAGGTDNEVHEVLQHHVGCVFGTGQTGLNHGEACLHEDHQCRADQHEDVVGKDLWVGGVNGLGRSRTC